MTGLGFTMPEFYDPTEAWNWLKDKLDEWRHFPDRIDAERAALEAIKYGSLQAGPTVEAAAIAEDCNAQAMALDDAMVKWVDANVMFLEMTGATGGGFLGMAQAAAIALYALAFAGVFAAVAGALEYAAYKREELFARQRDYIAKLVGDGTISEEFGNSLLHDSDKAREDAEKQGLVKNLSDLALKVGLVAVAVLLIPVVQQAMARRK